MVEVENESASTELDQLARQESHEDAGLAPLETGLLLSICIEIFGKIVHIHNKETHVFLMI